MKNFFSKYTQTTMSTASKSDLKQAGQNKTLSKYFQKHKNVSVNISSQSKQLSFVSFDHASTFIEERVNSQIFSTFLPY